MKSSGTGAVIEPLLALEREDLTGTVEFRARGVTTFIHARAGEIVFAEGGTLGETLGRMLVRCERLTEEHFSAIIRRLTDAHVDETAMHFGDIAVQYGFLMPAELDLALTQQVKEKLIGCIHRGAGEWRIEVGSTRAAGVGTHVVRTRPTLVEAALHFSQRRVEEILHLEASRYPELVAPDDVVAAEFDLTREETALLAELDGTSSLQFILPRATSPHAPALIAALVLGGGAVLRDAPGPESTREARSIPPSFRTLRRAAAREEESIRLPRISRGSFPDLSGSMDGQGSCSTIAVARPVPNRRSSRENLGPTLPDAPARAEAAFDRLCADLDARRPLSDRRRWPDPRDDEERGLMAESAFQRGRMYLRAEEAERALPGLHRALELCPEEQEYELYVKWAQMLVNETFKEDGLRAELEALAAVVVRRDHYCELAFAILGHCAVHQGKEEAALRFFQRAFYLDPELADAARLTELLATRMAGEGRASAKVDLRSGMRGDVETPLDAIVPSPIPATVTTGTDPHPTAPLFPTSPLSSLPPRRATSPAPPMSMPPASMPPSFLPPATPSDLRPPPQPMRQALSPWRIQAAPTSAGPMDPDPTPTPSPTPVRIQPLGTFVDEPVAPPKKRSRAAIVAIWVSSIGLTAAIFYFVGNREGVPAAQPEPSTSTEGAAPPTTTPASIETTPPPAVPAVTAAATPSATPTPSASSSAERSPTTTALRTPHAHGHRIFIDGRSAGEGGGHELTVACGVHRVRVGSAGVERSVNLPCGGVTTLE